MLHFKSIFIPTLIILFFSLPNTDCLAEESPCLNDLVEIRNNYEKFKMNLHFIEISNKIHFNQIYQLEIKLSDMKIKLHLLDSNTDAYNKLKISIKKLQFDITNKKESFFKAKCVFYDKLESECIKDVVDAISIITSHSIDLKSSLPEKVKMKITEYLNTKYSLKAKSF